jgi:hypothetical protein
LIEALRCRVQVFRSVIFGDEIRGVGIGSQSIRTVVPSRVRRRGTVYGVSAGAVVELGVDVEALEGGDDGC